jgi:HEXXH motif-containing protein
METRTPSDCDGACLPQAAGRGIDRVHARTIAALRAPALELLGHAHGMAAGWTQRVVAGLHDTLSALPMHDWLAAFRPSVAFFNLHPAVMERDPLAAALGLVRFVVGAPGRASGGFVIPEAAFAPAGLYLPHLGVVVAPGAGPLAVQLGSDAVRLTWSDGVSADLPTGRFELPRPDAAGRLLPVPAVAGWPLLNAVPEAHDAELPVQPPPAESIGAEELGLVEQAHELLQSVWPEAAAATQRFLHSLIVQPGAADHTTSVTLDFLQGTFIASLRDAVQVADAMVHEGSHTRLALLLRSDALVVDDGVARHASPWRLDPRPLKGVVNGVHAFLNVALFYRRLAERRPDLADMASEIYELQRSKVREAWALCAAHAQPTPLGRIFLDELALEVERL